MSQIIQRNGPRGCFGSVRPLLSVAIQIKIVGVTPDSDLLCDQLERLEIKMITTACLTDGNVKVTAPDRKLRMTRHVPTWSDRRLAYKAAWMAPGVTFVQNDISVA